MTRPAENQARGEAPTVAKLQQTVEAAQDAVMFAFDVALDAQRLDFSTRVEARRAFVAALRDLVAQAELAAELGEALGHGYWDVTTDEWRCAMCDAVDGHAEGCSHGALLARLDGAR